MGPSDTYNDAMCPGSRLIEIRPWEKIACNFSNLACNFSNLDQSGASKSSPTMQSAKCWPESGLLSPENACNISACNINAATDAARHDAALARADQRPLRRHAVRHHQRAALLEIVSSEIAWCRRRRAR
jgi:hypothetical protein